MQKIVPDIVNEVQMQMKASNNISPSLNNVYDAFAIMFPRMAQLQTPKYECVREQMIKGLKDYAEKKGSAKKMDDMIGVIMSNMAKNCFKQTA